MTGVDPKGLQSFALRQIGKIDLDGPEGHETITGVILEGDAAAVRSVGALFGERVSVVAALTPLKGAPDGPEEIEIDRLRLAAFKTNSNEDKAAYYLAVSKWFQDRHYRPLFASQPLPETEEKAP